MDDKPAPAPLTIATVVTTGAEVMVHCATCRELRPIKPYAVPARLRNKPLRELSWKCRKCGDQAALVIVSGQQGVGGLRPELDRFVPNAGRPPE